MSVSTIVVAWDARSALLAAGSPPGPAQTRGRPWHVGCFARSLCGPRRRRGRIAMLNWALVFLVFALIAGFLGFTGLAATAAGIAKVLFVVFLVLFLVSLIAGRGALRSPPV